MVPVTSGSRTLKDAINEAMRDWVTNVDTTHYLLGTVTGPHPFPVMVREFHRVIGEEARQQMLDLVGTTAGRGPRLRRRRLERDRHLHTPSCDDTDVALIGFEAGGEGVDDRPARGDASPVVRPGCCTAPGRTCCRTTWGRPSRATRSPPGSTTQASGPQHAWLHETGRATYRPVTDAEAMEAFALLCRTEGIIPAIESAHAVAGALQVGRELGPDAVLVVNLSGRGDKDVATAARWFGIETESPA